MITYDQKTGELRTAENELISVCYSGRAEGKNNPDMQHVKDTGPIPRGTYAIGKPYDSKVTGPHTLALIPDKKNNMFFRGGFAIHGDDMKHPGEASRGCIIASRDIREYIANNHNILVVK